VKKGQSLRQIVITSCTFEFAHSGLHIHTHRQAHKPNPDTRTNLPIYPGGAPSRRATVYVRKGLGGMVKE